MYRDTLIRDTQGSHGNASPTKEELARDFSAEEILHASPAAERAER
jgi:hypothetical protein